MPRYFFDIRDGNLIARDTEGMVFDTLARAIREAKRAVHVMALDDPEVDHSEVTIGIREGERVLTNVTSTTTVARWS